MFDTDSRISKVEVCVISPVMEKTRYSFAIIVTMTLLNN